MSAVLPQDGAIRQQPESATIDSHHVMSMVTAAATIKNG